MLAAVCLIAVSFSSDDTDLLFKTSRLNCKEWAQAANAYIALGEEAACSTLLEKERAHPTSKANVRACLICRILFNGKRGIRPPQLGDLSLPPLPSGSWPEFPLVQQDGVWFLLDENYRLGGKAEQVARYIDYCRQNGIFRTNKISVPTREQAGSALDSLTGSKRWRSIRWSDGDLHNSYTYDRQWTVDILRSETRFSDD